MPTERSMTMRLRAEADARLVAAEQPPAEAPKEDPVKKKPAAKKKAAKKKS